jgi:hypothetical protein
MKKLAHFIFFTILFTPLAIFPQTQDEVKAEVPDLKAFHSVIYKLWHNAWPEKDIALMAELVPEIEKGVEKVQKAQLPGILREKKPRWEEGVKGLTEVLKEYKMAIASKDTQKILDAGEKLHAQYEGMVRMLRPVLKEVDEFHKVLYPLYHYYMPEYKRDKIMASAVEMDAKMDSLRKAELPERLRAKGKDFNRSVEELARAVKYFVKVAKEIDDEKTVTDAIKDLHTKYQQLEKVFE